MNSIKDRIKKLYPFQYEDVYDRTKNLIELWKPKINLVYPWVDKNDIMLITYGDGIQRKEEAPLKTLKALLDEELEGYISAVHLLPMFPYTSDDGFSVSDFRLINPDLGDWEDIDQLKVIMI